MPWTLNGFERSDEKHHAPLWHCASGLTISVGVWDRNHTLSGKASRSALASFVWIAINTSARDNAAFSEQTAGAARPAI
jgi:hypothetical protein